MRVDLDVEAEEEAREAARFYEDCRAGLGQEFLNAIEHAFGEIVRHPQLWRKIKGRFRRFVLRRFPYGVIYAVEGERIYVAAVMNLTRKPDYWLPRARNRRSRRI